MTDRSRLALTLSQQLTLPGIFAAVDAGALQQALYALPPSRRAILKVLISFARRGVSWPSQRRIAGILRRSVRTVIRAIADLRSCGALYVAHDRSQALRTLAAYALHPSLLSPNTRCNSPRRKPACDKSHKQRQVTNPRAREPLDRRRIAELELRRAGLPGWAAAGDVARIGADVALRRLEQAMRRPAWLRGEVKNPVGYLRACLGRDLPEPAEPHRIFAPAPDREFRRNYAIAMQRERDREHERREFSIGARDVMDRLRFLAIAVARRWT